MMLYYTYNISWQIINGLLYIIDERDSYKYSLDNVGKDFWLMIGKLHNYEKIKYLLLEKYNVKEDVLEKDLRQLIENLIKKEFIKIVN